MAIGCLLFGSWGFPAGSGARFRDAIVVLAAFSFLADTSYFQLRVGKSASHTSIVFIPYIASMLLFESGWAMLIACAVTALADQFVRRKPGVKVVFNAAQHGMAVWAGAVVFGALGGVPALSSQATLAAGGPQITLDWIPIAAASVVYFLVNSTAVSLAVSLSDGFPFGLAWSRVFGTRLVYDLVSAPLGVLLAFLYVKLGMLGVLATLLPLFMVSQLYRTNVQLEEVNRELLELMVKAIEARDPYTSGHSQRVSDLAVVIARELGIGSKQVEQIRTAALLHDVGKIYEEYAPLLRKEGKLTPTEKALMQTHSLRSAELASTISGFRGTVAEAIRHHHENYDGTGYPNGLAGESIPVGSRVIMIADTIDAMTTDRPYRLALPLERVLGELERYSGRQFDPKLVAVVMRSEMIKAAIGGRSGSSASGPPSFMSVSIWRRRASVAAS